MLACLAAAGPSLADDSKLRRYTECDGFAGGVRAVIRDQRPQDAAPWREVRVGGELRRVSVVDGYRVIYSYPRTYAFANLKVERSDPANYAEDRRIVTQSLAEMASADADTQLSAYTDRGFLAQTLTKKELRGTTLAIAQILSDEDAVIVTIFFLNHPPENRQFQTYEEFVALRDAFMRGYVECAAKRKVNR